MSEPLHPEEVVTNLVLVRHGQTPQTQGGLLYCDHQAELTERGQSQAHHAGGWLKRENIEVLLSSTAVRVRTTADIIGKELVLAPHAIEGLDEWNVGRWEGMSYWDIKKKEPALYDEWSKDPIANAPPGGESIVDLCSRVKQRIADVCREYAGKRIALVTHAGVIRAILVDALGMPVVNFWRLAIPTGSITKVDLSSNFATLQYLGVRPE